MANGKTSARKRKRLYSMGVRGVDKEKTRFPVSSTQKKRASPQRVEFGERKRDPDYREKKEARLVSCKRGLAPPLKRGKLPQGGKGNQNEKSRAVCISPEEKKSAHDVRRTCGKKGPGLRVRARILPERGGSVHHVRKCNNCITREKRLLVSEEMPGKGMSSTCGKKKGHYHLDV